MSRLRSLVVDISAGLDGDGEMSAVEAVVLCLIVANTLAVVLESVDSVAGTYGPLLDAVEYVAVALFTVEFAVRVAGRMLEIDDRASLRDPYLLVDLLAIVPFYVGLAVGIGGLHASSFGRVLRFLKLVRYVDGVDLLVQVVRRKRSDLAVSGLATGVLWVLAASAMYFAEHDAQPETFSSIPATLWWAGVTITTVGYGDVYPVTPLGRLVGVVVSFLGVGVAAVPSSILVSGILEASSPDEPRCPDCERRVDE
ncbi:ion transporter [Haloarchaeobius baliensis]|uniref:ion transporter n=1 Tax=Haloarchaeobius baliensis TaxID=1670458 RepID=UPI003F883170